MSFLENIDKNKLQKILLIVISALVLAALVCLVVIIITSVAPAPSINNGFELDDYTLSDKDVNFGSLILADAKHPYSGNEANMNLVGCQGFRNAQMTADGIEVIKENYSYIAYAEMKLSTDAMTAAHKMITDAKNAVGEKAITVDGAYGQVINGDKELEEYKTALLLLLADYNSEGNSPVGLSDGYRSWFDKNAAKYGYLESFEDAYRYVGVPHAKHMTNEKLSLAEYIEYLKNNTSAEKALSIKVDNDSYAVYYVQGKVGDTIKVPQQGDYSISGTNEGGVIVTVKLAK